MTPVLEMTGLGKRYGRLWALRGCSLALPGASVIGLVGPNGAGKTTLLELAVGLLEPTSGGVQVLGEPPAGWRQGHPGVGYVSQEQALYPHFTVTDLVRMGAALNRRWDAAVAWRRLDQLDIPRWQRAGKLSGGQKAQVALALTLAKRPELLILDEPLSSLDPVARRDFMATVMTAAAEERLTVLFSSHVVAELERVCDYLVVLSHGQVQLDGNIEELLAGHHRLIGPAEAVVPAGVAAVVAQTRTGRQANLIVRDATAAYPPVWQVADLTLEDLVLGYMEHPACGARSGPRAVASSGTGS